MPLRRTIKNVVKNYSDAQVKVREATSNDPWGPSSTLMTEIADLTYNVLAFTEIMQMIWKRLNDHGRNWRHVYKSLVLLEYIVKTGSEKVAHQCRENIFAIQTLKDFQYIEDAKDHGLNVREKAKQLVSLLKDSERLKNERAKALKAKERFAQTNAGVSSGAAYPSASPILPNVVTFSDSVVGKYSGFGSPSSWSLEGGILDAELEAARPTSTGEEELQLELALAMSKEEHEQQMKLMKGDEVKLQMALEQSKKESEEEARLKQNGKSSSPTLDSSDPWLEWKSENSVNEAFKNPWMDDNLWVDPNASKWPPTTDLSSKNVAPASDQNTAWHSSCLSSCDIFKPPAGAQGIDDAFDDLGSRTTAPSACGDKMAVSNQPQTIEDKKDPWQMGNLEMSIQEMSATKSHLRKSPKDFLGENASLVNLDNLMSPSKSTGPPPFNPFAVSSNQSRGTSPTFITSNPFLTPDMHVPAGAVMPGTTAAVYTTPFYQYPQLHTQPTNPNVDTEALPKSTYPSEFNPFL